VTGVTIVDVGPRDGLQNAPTSLAPDVRAELCARIARAGVPRVEAVSFVHPRRVPQMAGSEEVVAALPAIDGTAFCGLVLNERGCERLLASGLTQLRYTFAATDAFNLRNAGMTTAAGLEAARRILRAAKARGLQAGVVIATAFGCPFEGEIDGGAVVALAAQLAAEGAEEIVFADTIGVATPRQVRALLEGSAGLGPALGVHLHNTRNTGYANAYAALGAGAEILDASLGGLGGCPFAPCASGNVASEDLLYLLEREGVETGIDLDALAEAARWLKQVSGLTLDGQVHRVERFPPSGADADVRDRDLLEGVGHRAEAVGHAREDLPEAG
jgi:isopropylmalate/homocitrate/citramalate synthase